MATYPLTWLADVLRDAGCTVVEESGWKTRGRDGSFAPKAVMLHHDASPKGQTSNGVDVIRDGREDLPGPLAQLWLDYDGRWHVVAAGRANHGGEGGPWGVVSLDDANTDAIGIETDHTADEHWTNSQLSEGIKGVAALCRRLGIDTEAEIGRAVLAHKEYTSRKIDPDPLNMTKARANLWTFLQTGGGVAAMADVKKFLRSKDQTVANQWTTLQIDDAGSLSFLVGPIQSYHVVTGLTLLDVPAGVVVAFRYVLVNDYPDDRDTVTEAAYPQVDVTSNGGATYAQLTWSNDLGGDAGDAKRKLRLQAYGPAAGARIGSLTSRVLA